MTEWTPDQTTLILQVNIMYLQISNAILAGKCVGKINKYFKT